MEPSSTSVSAFSFNRNPYFRNYWSKYCLIKQRRIIIILLCICACLTFTLRRKVISSVMSAHSNTNKTRDMKDTCTFPVEDQTDDEKIYNYKLKHEWDTQQEKLVVTSFYWGYILTQLPAGYIADFYGGKYVIFFGFVSSSVLAFISPTVTNRSMKEIKLMVIMRFINGLMQGFILPSLTNILAQWSPIKERTIMFCAAHSSLVLGLPAIHIFGYLIASAANSWEVIHYFFGSLAITWAIAWVILGYSTPEYSPFITYEEKGEIYEELDQEIDNKNPKSLPWRNILTSKPVWAFLIAEIGFDWGLFTLALHSSQYVKSVLKFDQQYGHFWPTLPYCFSWMLTMIFGCLSDWLIYEKKANKTVVRKVFHAISVDGVAILLMCMAWAGCHHSAFVLFTAGVSLTLGNYAGSTVNSIDLAPNFAGSLMGLGNCVGCILGSVTPMVAGVVVPNDTLTEWKNMFLITFFVMTGTSVLYLILGSSSEQVWNKLSTK